jgi:hypothetical protein
MFDNTRTHKHFLGILASPTAQRARDRTAKQAQCFVMTSGYSITMLLFFCLALCHDGKIRSCGLTEDESADVFLSAERAGESRISLTDATLRSRLSCDRNARQVWG